MSGTNRQRVLVISQNREANHELVTLLSGYGYFVEFCQTRFEGVRKFRSHKQPIVILDVNLLRKFPSRLFRFINMVRKNTIVLITASKKDEALAFEKVPLGAYDVLNLPLRTEFLKLTLDRALDHHTLLREAIFVKNIVFFSLLVLPVWAALAYFLMK